MNHGGSECETMNKKAYRKVKHIFLQSLDVSEEEVEAFIFQASKGDKQIITQVNELLKTYRETTKHTSDYVHEVADAISNSLSYFPSDRYILIKKIGQGGMGTVFLAQRKKEGIKQKVAIKLMKIDRASEINLARFNQECSILSQLSHPHIAQFIDSDYLKNGHPYVVMEYAPGKSFTHYADTQKLSLTKILKYFVELCDAVSYAHRNLIIHRDIKPSNVLVSNTGVLKLIDFGIAKDVNQMEDKTETGQNALTPIYASPEQFLGQSVNVASDVYSLGVLLYELLTGVTPLEEKHFSKSGRVNTSVYQKIKPPSLRLSQLLRENDQKASTIIKAKKRWLSELTGDLDQVVLKALQFDASRRYLSVSEFRDDILHYLNNEPVIAREPSSLYRVSKFLKRNLWSSMVALLVIIMTVTSIIVISLQNTELKKQRNEAVREQNRAEVITEGFLQAFKNADPMQTLGNEVNAGQILEETVRLLEREKFNDPVLRSRLGISIAEVYNNMGAFNESEEVLDLAKAHQADWTDNLMTAWLIQRSKALRNTGKGQEALELLNQAPPSFVNNINFALEKSNVLIETADLDEAEILTNDILNGLSEKSSLYTEACIQLVRVLQFKGQSADVPKRIQTCLNKSSDSPEFSNVWNRSLLMEILARSYQSEEEYPISTQYYLGALDLRKQIFGEDHISQVRLYKGLGWNTMRNDDFETSLEFQNTAIDIYTAAVGADNPILATAIYNRAHVYFNMGNESKAISEYKKAVQLMRDAGQEDSHRIGFYLKTLGSSEFAVGDFSSAESSLQKARDVFLKKGGTYVYRAAECEVLLVQVYVAQNRIEIATSTLKRVLPNMYVMHRKGDSDQVLAEQLATRLGIDNPYKSNLMKK